MKKQSVLITGTSSGIGLAAAGRFYEAGYEVAATVRKDADAQMLAGRFPHAQILNVELSDESAINSVIGRYLADRGGVDVVVNNAGFACIGPVEELSMDKWRAQMETNFFAVVNITRLALPYMREKGFGRIVQVSSGAGQSVIPIFAPYCTSKHAVEAFSEALRYEVAPFGIGVSVIGPGPVASKFDANRSVVPEDEISQSPYRELYSAMRRRTQKSHQNESSAEEVVEQIYRAATTSFPRFRYEVGLLGYAATLSRFLPRRVLDLSMRAIAR